MIKTLKFWGYTILVSEGNTHLCATGEPSPLSHFFSNKNMETEKIPFIKKQSGHLLYTL